MISKNGHLAITYVPSDLIDIEDQPMPEHSPEEHEGLKQSISEIGIGEPINVALKSDGRYRALDGRDRLKVAIELNHTEIPCILRNVKNDYRSFLFTYDLELFRRRLSDEDRKRLLTERNRLKRKWIQKTFDDHLQKIIPELHEDVKGLFEKTKDLDVVIRLALLPLDMQKTFYREVYVSTTGQEAEQKLAKALQKQKEYESEKAKLIEEVEELQQYKQKYEQLEKQHNTFLNLKRKEIEEEMRKREDKLREQYKTETPQEIQKMLLEERKRIEAEYKKEIETYQKELRDMSKAKAEAQKLIDIKQDELDRTNQNLNMQKDISEKYRHETDRYKNILRTATSPQKIPRRILAVREDLNSVYQSLLMIGEAAVTEKRQIILEIEQIEKTLNDIKKFLNEPIADA